MLYEYEYVRTYCRQPKAKFGYFKIKLDYILIDIDVFDRTGVIQVRMLIDEMTCDD